MTLVITSEAEAHGANRAYDYLISRGFTPTEARSNIAYLMQYHVHTVSCTDEGYGSCY